MKKQASQTSSSTFVAFLRGINVGGNSIIKMEDLKKLFAKLGFSNLKTILASGNVVFDASEKSTDAITALISAAMEKKMGRKISIMVRALDDLRNMEAAQPFKAFNPGPKAKLFITFVPDFKKTWNTVKPEVQKGYSIIRITDGMVVSMVPEDSPMGSLDLMEAIESRFGKQVTTRTWNTVQKVVKAGV
ncbi:MAG TPA: DUF1697 domain-containing protein [Bacteroidia bacterium]|jgi:uncharacterized protein (DUF1697 family)|nr:DUF1697 domain-containing protein [Bacteroidia bacterium]